MTGPNAPARSFASLNEALWTLFELPPSEAYRAGSVATVRVDRERGLLGVVCLGTSAELLYGFQINGEPAIPRFRRHFFLCLEREGVLAVHILWFPMDAAFHSFTVSDPADSAGSALPVIHFGAVLPRLGRDECLSSKPPPVDPRWLAWLSKLCRMAGMPRLIRWLGRGYAGSWLFVDRGFMADDNAEHLYRWVMRHHPGQRIVFALHRRSPDWDRLEREGFSLVDIAGPRYLAACFNCAWLISSQRADYIAKHYWRRWHTDTVRYRFCFLQHGITMNYMPRLNNPHADLLISAALPEYEAFSADPQFAYVYSERETRLTGFPRHDALLHTAGERSRPETILIMPTWRHTLAEGQTKDGQFLYEEGFEGSEFFRRWQAVMQSEQLLRTARECGYQVRFYPHPHLRPQVRHFYLDGVTVIPETGGSLQDILADTALLITDYSSIAMDVALLRRPVLYFQFDRDSFFNRNLGQGRGRGYFDHERDGFGQVVTEEREVCLLAEEAMRNGCRMKDLYRKRADAFFPFSDQENCRRVYEALLGTD